MIVLDRLPNCTYCNTKLCPIQSEICSQTEYFSAFTRKYKKTAGALHIAPAVLFLFFQKSMRPVNEPLIT